jgi:hypothetical protein
VLINTIPHELPPTITHTINPAEIGRIKATGEAIWCNIMANKQEAGVKTRGVFLKGCLKEAPANAVSAGSMKNIYQSQTRQGVLPNFIVEL